MTIQDFTARPGQPPARAFILGFQSPGLPAPPVVVVPSAIPTFTAIPGISLARPGNIIPGRAFMRLRAGQSLAAELIPTATLAQALRGRLLYTSVASFITQIRPISLKVVQRTTTQLDSLPASVDIAVSERVPLSIDVSNYLAGSDSINSPTAVLKLASTKAVIPSASWLAGTISSASTTVQIPINVTALAVGQTYILLTTFVANLTSGKTMTITTTLNVVA